MNVLQVARHTYFLKTSPKSNPYVENCFAGAARLPGFQCFISMLGMEERSYFLRGMQRKSIPNEGVRGELSDVESLTEERVDEILNEFLIDFKEGSLESKGWPTFLSANTVSKVAMNAYTRILAKKYPSFCINCVCPGYVKTNINFNSGILTVEEGAKSPMRLALLLDSGPSGIFFISGVNHGGPTRFLFSNTIFIRV
ncbi:hypothetical protein L1049_009026 [Liquidambar formosana]|uniref:(+)-neomenthol dehydrogenase-like n=1 Tax=Liquidambar formosana TaxID=63359 RepID=A0AAP0S782_LIQFO